MSTLLKITAAVAALVIGISYVFLKRTEQMELSSNNRECIKDNNQLLSVRGSVDSSKLASVLDNLGALSFETINLTDDSITYITGSYAVKIKVKADRKHHLVTGKDSKGVFDDFLQGDIILRVYLDDSYFLKFSKYQYLLFSYGALFWDSKSDRFHLDARAILEETKMLDKDKPAHFEIQVTSGALKRYRVSKESTETAFLGIWLEPGQDEDQAQMMQHFVRLAEELKQECEKQ